MKTNLFRILMFGLSMIILISNNSYAQMYSGGLGTTDNPFKVANKVDLKYLSEHSEDWINSFIQTANIAFTSVDFKIGGDFYNSGKGFNPIGNYETTFTGNFDGNSYFIDSLFMNSETEGIGFFGFTGFVSSLSNISLRGCNVKGNGNYLGALVGNNNGEMNNCHSTGFVYSNISMYDIGGLVGYNSRQGIINNCYSMCDVIDSMDRSNVGGLVGSNDNEIELCYSSGKVIGEGIYSNAGGFVGRNNSSIINCYSSSNVTRTKDDGFVGGFAGINYNSIKHCYASGIVNNTGMYCSVGGMIAINEGTTTNLFWDTDVSGQSTSDAGVGKTTIEMKTQSTFTDWDFVGESTNGNDDIWKMDILGCYGGYPIFVNQNNTLPQISTIENGDACTNATATLNASTTDVTNTLQWFVSSIGGASMHTGNVFITPVLSQSKSFWVEAQNGACISSRTEVVATVSVCTGINDPADVQNAISIFPNPTKNKIQIQYATTISSVEVYNMMGIKLYQSNTNTKEIDLTSFSNGVYLIIIHDQAGNVFSKRVERMD
ncbi:GLUG motif-containing protein [uncultured Cytophaga sp.]|uniref:GLUG motif-containing protein n=1 Tax=uncultured Cytophaga sp. TaxID=160238 RepID=UPI00261C6B72|nr:GLUG motif-containing protein [uncultured Cytophaga sp.]